MNKKRNPIPPDVVRLEGLTPGYGCLVVKPFVSEEYSDGFKVAEEPRQMMKGTVLMVGRMPNDGGWLLRLAWSLLTWLGFSRFTPEGPPFKIHVGDVVWYTRTGNVEIELNGTMVRVVRWRDILVYGDEP